MVPILFPAATLLPFWLHSVVAPARKLCEMIFQLTPLLMTFTLSFVSSNDQDETFSIVCDKLVAIVQTGTGIVVLAFLM